MKTQNIVIQWIKKNSFVLLLLCAFISTDILFSAWDPMRTSLVFYKDDFNKTLLSHNQVREAPLFYGNSAVAAAFIEQESSLPLVEMGLSYGKIADLQAILKKDLYRPEGMLIIGIDPHIMLDKLDTDPTYPWFKSYYVPYVYFYRDYMREVLVNSAKSFAGNISQGKLGADLEKVWTDKMLYFGQLPPDKLKEKWEGYERQFGWMSVEKDFVNNLEALIWVLEESERRKLPVGIVWMPVNFSEKYPAQSYWEPLQKRIQTILEAYQVPSLDLRNQYPSQNFHDFVHIERVVGAPKFTQDIKNWLKQPNSIRLPQKRST
ncbi:hypothetical protein [Paenibacillus sp. OAS669]|uniref:hypothetical protein n=1 Tax=Paenibacillus sp. OAS669 TaxID=2663821 RepID=UPI0019E2D687|nr:hypothetical protein [Paenibacillus sp. OAS669]MBE1442306.1 RNAse (barnase) inhibitor barstar [Paenibacillus sp. OAS669]